MDSLRHLDVSWCRTLEKLPDGIGRLTLLQTLGRFTVVGGRKGGCSNIWELGGLTRLRGDLYINNLDVVMSGDEARTAKLEDKTSLGDLLLCWNFWGHHISYEEDIDVLEGLRPPPQLEKLHIVNYPGGTFPTWLGDASTFLLLRDVTLSYCMNCTQLPPLGQLPCLRSLENDRLLGVKKVGEELLGGTSIPFPQLERLTFTSMQSWEQWASPASMPRLCDLSLSYCPKLEEVPPIFTTSLQQLRIEDAPLLLSLHFLPPSIQYLRLAQVSTVKLFKHCPTLPALKHLRISDDSEMTELPSTLLHLPDLQSLHISCCENLVSLPEELLRLTNLHKLKIFSCPELSESCMMGSRLWPRIAHIPCIEIDHETVQDKIV